MDGASVLTASTRVIWLGLGVIPYLGLVVVDAWMHERAREVPTLERISDIMDSWSKLLKAAAASALPAGSGSHSPRTIGSSINAAPCAVAIRKDHSASCVGRMRPDHR